jgi:TP901 family phage tail tape measure protein
MAKDSVTIDFLLNTRDADRDLARIRKEMERLGVASGKALKGFGGTGGEKVRALGSGLSKATVKADEFTKSLEASNARVVAFGASAGIIMQIDRAFKGMVSSTLKVEKALLDVNVVMNASQKSLKKFGQGMFQVGKQTAQGFDTVAEAATELARQGLGMEKTLMRTKDALILTRLTGMDAAEAVKSLTAAVNSFNKEGVTSAQVINKMAKVDAAFAVSSDDLAKSISRVGASAVSAGVSMDELLAITTAVQQRTARGGAVIGNAFKTIFTRLQRKDVLQNLRNLGIAVTDFNGEALSGIQVLQNLAGGFSTLSKATQAQTAEQVAGVFQVNILKAAMADLSSTTSNYGRALRTASSATDEAYRRNEQLNQSLDALVNRTMSNLTQAGAGLGGATIEPAIRRTLGVVNGVLESFGEGGALADFGKNWGKGIMQGLGDFIAGPGLVVITATVSKLFYNLTKFTGKAFADIMNINKASQQRQGIQTAIVETLAKEPLLLQSVLRKDTSILSLEQQILKTLQAQTLARAAMTTIAAPIAASVAAKGARIGRSGGLYMGSAGFIPNFASAGAERAGAAAGGYKAGAIRTMTQPGGSRVMYNSAETVKRFPGMSQSAIMPPRRSLAGANYKSAFSAAHGFNPYAAEGFVPNFAAGSAIASTLNRNKGARTLGIQAELARKQGKPAPVNLDVAVDISKMKDIGIITEEGTATTPIMFSQQALGPKGIPALQKMLPRKMFDGKDGKILQSLMLRMSPLPAVPIFPFSQGTDTFSNTVGEFPSLQRSFTKYAKDLSRQLFPNSKARKFNMKALSKGTEGDIFEEGMRAAVDEQSLADRSAAFDYNGPNYANKDLIAFINKKGGRLKPTRSKIEAKIGTEAAMSGNIPKKVVNDALAAGMNVGPNINNIVKAIATKYEATAGGTVGVLNTTGKAPTRGMNKALGHIPNFAVSPLTNAIGRELSAGVPSSAIRVGSSNSLVSGGNPGGLGVYNTIHEPAGLGQGISRARSRGINPKSHGVPNFFDETTGAGRPHTGSVDVDRYKDLDKGLKDAGKAAKDSAKASKAATSQTRRMGAAMGGMLVQMAAGAAASKMEEGSIEQTLTRGGGGIAGFAGMGMMMGGPWGAAAGGALGAASLGMDLVTQHTYAATRSFEVLSAELAEMEKKGSQVSEAIANLGSNLAQLRVETTPEKRLAKGREVTSNIRGLISKLEGSPTAQKNVQGMLDRITGGGGFTSYQELEQIQTDANREYQKGLRSKKFEVMGSKLASITEKEAANAGGFQQYLPAPIQQEFAQGNTGRGLEMLAPGTGWPLLEALHLPFRVAKDFDVPVLKHLAGEGMMEEFQREIGSARKARAARATPDFYSKFMGTKALDQKGDIGTVLRNNPEALSIIQGLTAQTSRLGPSGGRNYDIFRSSPLMAAGGGFEKRMDKAMDVAGIASDARTAFKKTVNTPEARIAFINMLSGRGIPGAGSGWISTDVKGRKAKPFASQFSPQSIKQDIGLAESASKLAPEEQKAAARIGARETRSFVEGLRQASVASKNRVKETQLEIKQSTELRKVQNNYDMALAKATKDTFGVADAKLAQSLNEAAKNFENASRVARETFDSQMASDVAGFAKEFETFASKFDKGTWGRTGTAFDPKTGRALPKGAFGLPFGGGVDVPNIDIARSTFQSLGRGGTDALQERILAVQEKERKKGTLTIEEQIVKEFGPKVLDKLLTRSEELDQKMKELGIQNSNAKTLAEKQNAIDKKMLEISRQFNKDKANELAITKQIVDQKKLVYYEDLRAAGKMSAADVLSQQDITQRNRMRTEGINQSDIGGAFGRGFRGGMTYDDYALFDDLKSGGADAAASMKSSFADAFKSITSGATDARSAIAQFADSILNTISDITARIGTNMLFSQMGFSRGGSVPGYNRGGIVTGGSGYKDDVPAMMNGGEFVIKKSAAQKIGYSALNAINGGAPGYSMGGMFAVSAGASAVSGLINQSNQKQASPWRGQDYGHGRGAYGYYGGPDVNATGASFAGGSSQSAAISLSKGFNFYRRDPATGRLVSERSRPTEGAYDVSSGLSLAGRLGADDPQTARMFSREEAMGGYQDYLTDETRRRKEVVRAHEAKKRGRLISAYANAAMLIGGSYMMGKTGPLTSELTGASVSGGGRKNFNALSASQRGGMSARDYLDAGVGINDSGLPDMAQGGSAKRSPAMLMGGEYVMSPDTVRTHGLGFMNELNRGNVPGYANGGYVGSAGTVGAGINNNVSINVNVDKRGNASVDASQDSSNASSEGSVKEAEKNKQLGAALQTVVVQEIIKQQRPGGLLQNTTKFGSV